MSRCYADIAIVSGGRQLDMLFTYGVPEAFCGQIALGTIVLVPFGNRNGIVHGYVAALHTDENYVPEFKGIKNIIQVVDGLSLTDQQVVLAEWIRDYYLTSWTEAASLIMPTGLDIKGYSLFKPVMGASLDDGAEGSKLKGKILEVFQVISAQPGIRLDELKKLLGDNVTGYLNRLEAAELIERQQISDVKAIMKTEKIIDLNYELTDLTDRIKAIPPAYSKQVDVLKVLYRDGATPYSELRQTTGVEATVIRSLLDKKLVTVVHEETLRLPDLFDDGAPFRENTLNREQQRAFDTVVSSLDTGHSHFLLKGVTGSGKTEVYIKLAKAVIDRGETCLVLVPEISLTPQIVNKFAKSGDFKIAVFHSRLSAGERLDQWRMVREGRVDLIIGARSALFSPFNRLGLIIMDEEHDGSYKSDQSPKYDGKTVAEQLARMNQCPLVLGSATPSLATHMRVETGSCTLLELKERFGEAVLPEVSVIDMRNELASGNRTIFSHKLRQAIEDRLSRGEQTILYMNRKGHSTFVSCRECGFVLKCPHCDISLTYYKNGNSKCSYCGYEVKTHTQCPSCQSRYFKFFGNGTEKIEELVREAFPTATIDRLDSTVTARKGAAEKVLMNMGAGHTDILIGTQLVAKGLDFPAVTLVGVITADTLLNLPDFTASERTFQLLTQVAGRAGRGDVLGEVVIQTYTPDDYAVSAAALHDYEGFISQEADLRRTFAYPPYNGLVSIMVSSEDALKAAQGCDKLAKSLKEELADQVGNYETIGPNPALVARVKGRYRFQLVLKVGCRFDETRLKIWLRQITIKDRDKFFGKDVSVSVDFRAQSLL